MLPAALLAKLTWVRAPGCVLPWTMAWGIVYQLIPCIIECSSTQELMLRKCCSLVVGLVVRYFPDPLPKKTLRDFLLNFCPGKHSMLHNGWNRHDSGWCSSGHWGRLPGHPRLQRSLAHHLTHVRGQQGVCHWPGFPANANPGTATRS